MVLMGKLNIASETLLVVMVDGLIQFLGIGGGYTWVDDIGFGTANALAGVTFLV